MTRQSGNLWVPRGEVAAIREAMGKPDPLARAADPETSKAAARGIVPHLGALQQAAADAVRRWPGRTATELAVNAGHADPRVFNRRLGECERLGMVRRGEPRRCKATGRQAATWWPGGEA